MGQEYIECLLARDSLETLSEALEWPVPVSELSALFITVVLSRFYFDPIAFDLNVIFAGWRGLVGLGFDAGAGQVLIGSGRHAASR